MLPTQSLGNRLDISRSRLMFAEFFISILIIVVCIYIILNIFTRGKTIAEEKFTLWKVQAIDTVKYSRDLAREKQSDTSFDGVIESQVHSIAELGATHVSIGTPYDEEFIPYLRRWVYASRKNNLKVWFRGNLSGWEGWFDYGPITRQEHKDKIKNFILRNTDLFEDGDIFTTCTECENGVVGDPRQTKDVYGFRRFLIEEYMLAKESFRIIDKEVSANYFSMNADVARIVMDKETTKKLDGIVVIDHYVASPEKLDNDIREISQKSGGKVVLGEFGAPIPDIHGKMSEDEQVEWISDVMLRISENKNLLGVNYWTSFGASTQIWDENGNVRKFGDVLKKYYQPKIFKGIIKNEIGYPLKGVAISTDERSTHTNEEGTFSLPYIEDDLLVKIWVSGYKEDKYLIVDKQDVVILLKKEKEDALFKIIKNIYKAFN